MSAIRNDVEITTRIAVSLGHSAQKIVECARDANMVLIITGDARLKRAAPLKA